MYSWHLYTLLFNIIPGFPPCGKRPSPPLQPGSWAGTKRQRGCRYPRLPLPPPRQPAASRSKIEKRPFHSLAGSIRNCLPFKCSRKIVSWKVSNTMDTDFCVAALEEASNQWGIPAIFNTDQAFKRTKPIEEALTA